MIKELTQKLNEAQLLNDYAGYNANAKQATGSAEGNPPTCTSSLHYCHNGPVSLKELTYDLPPDYYYVKYDGVAYKKS